MHRSSCLLAALVAVAAVPACAGDAPAFGKVVPALPMSAKLAAALAAGLPRGTATLPAPVVVSVRQPVAPLADVAFTRTAAVWPSENYAMLTAGDATIIVRLRYQANAIYLADCTFETSFPLRVNIAGNLQKVPTQAQHLLFALPGKPASSSMMRQFTVYGLKDQFIVFHGCEITKVK